MKLIFLIAIVLVRAVGCEYWDNGSPPPDLPETWLSEIIQTVPSDMGADYLLFANQEAARVEADATDFQGLDTVFGSGGLSSIPWTYGGLPSVRLGVLTHYSEAVTDTLGLDIFLFDHGIWSPVAGEPPRPPFAIIIAKLDDAQNLPTRLMDAGYKADAYAGVSFSYFWRDIPPQPRVTWEHPMRMNLFELNAIATIEDALVISRKVPMLEELIDAHEGNAPSLWDEEPWRILTRMVGDELLGGALLSPEYVASRTATGTFINRSAEERLEDWKRYASGPDAWGTLEPYTAVVLGYGVRDGVEGTTIAMYHPDPVSAERNADELKRRWESARLDLRPFSGHDIPFTEICAPLETRIEAYENSSVLIATCPALEQPDPISIDALWRGFWMEMISDHELHFLVPNMAELTTAP